MSPETSEDTKEEQDVDSDNKVIARPSLKKQLTEKFESFKFEIEEQRKQQKLAALKKDANGNRPPEVRLGRITASGLVPLEFTNEMNFPSLSELIHLNEESGGKLIELGIKEDGAEEDEAGDSDNLAAWSIKSLNT